MSETAPPRTGSATPLLGEPRRAALAFGPAPVFFALAPVALVSFLPPFASVWWPPLWRSITPPSLPVRRGHAVVPDGNLENRRRNVRGLNHRPWAVPCWPEVPSSVVEDPVIIAVEEDVGRGAGSVVHRCSRNDHEGGRPREPDPDVDLHLAMNGSCRCCHEERAEQESRHALLPSNQSGTNFRAAPFMQYRRPVGLGPSSNTWPRCP